MTTKVLKPVAGSFDGAFSNAAAALEWWSERVTQSATKQPTSSLTGGGAIAEVEDELGQRLSGKALLLPSGSTALRLAATSARPGSIRVCYPGNTPTTWPGRDALMHSMGCGPGTDNSDTDGSPAADPKAVDVSAGLAISASRADYAEPIAHDSPYHVLDAARCSPDDYADIQRSSWDAVCLSFGPSKAIDAGEAGALVVRDDQVWSRAVAVTQHPIRQLIAGIDNPEFGVCERVHPVAAVMILHSLRTKWSHT